MNIFHQLITWLNIYIDSAVLSTMVTLLTLIFALFMCFSGYRFRKVYIGIVGFILGFFIGTFISSYFVAGYYQLIISIAIGLAIAIIFTVISFYILKTATVIWIAIVTFYVVLSYTPKDLFYLGLAIGVILAILAIYLVRKFLKPVIIVITSLCGGLEAIQALQNILLITNKTIWLFITLIIIIAGLITQFVTSKRH